MTETRFIAVSPEQAEALEVLGRMLRRMDDPYASRIQALAIAWRYAPTVTRIPFGDDHSLRLDADFEGRDVAARRLRVLDGGGA